MTKDTITFIDLVSRFSQGLVPDLKGEIIRLKLEGKLPLFTRPTGVIEEAARNKAHADKFEIVATGNGFRCQLKQ